MTDATKASEVAEKLIREADELDDYISALAGRIRTAEDEGGFDNRALVFELEAETAIVRAREADLRAAASLIRAQSERERALVEALEVISGTSSKLCPFTRGVPNNLQPEDPCPVCRDKGDFSDETTNSPSRCVGNAPSAIARAALTKAQP